MTRIQIKGLARLLSSLMEGIGGSATWWTMGRLAAVVLAAGVLAACVQEGAAPPAATRETGAAIVYENISFMLPESVARWASGESIAAVESGPDTPWWEPAPQHAAITLVGYPVGGSVWTPRIVVYPVQELAAVNPEAASRIELLRQLLETQALEPGSQLPFLPLTNAGGRLQAGVEFLTFGGGRGVRYLAQHGQGPAPINNQELFYTLQGLTDDGTHYIAAILPMTHASLPASTENLPESEWQALVENFAQYIAEVTTALEAQPDESFTPSLADLDAMVQSISVTP